MPLQQLGTQIDLRIATLSSIAANLNIDINSTSVIPNQAVTISSGWKRTASPSESQRIFQDWSLLSQYVASEARRQAVFKEICNQGVAQGQADGRLVALTMDNPGVRNNVYTIDKMTFEQMSTHLDSAAHDLLKLIDTQDKSKSLREQQATTFRDLDEEYKIAQFHYDASLLGIEVAQKAIEIANLGKAAASIDMQINQLNLQIAAINNMTAADRSKVAGLQQELASEALELAEQKVAALEDAEEKAQQMVADAIGRLRQLNDYIDTNADKIEEDEEKAHIFSILKGVADVIGIALTPFIGPSGLQAAAMANQLLDAAQQASNTDWSDPIKGLGEVVSAGQAVAGVFSQAINTWGSDDIKKQLGNFEAKIKNWGNDAPQWLKGDGKAVSDALDFLKTNGRTQDVNTLIRAVKSGFSLSVDGLTIVGRDGKVIGGNLFKIKDPQIVGAVGEILDAGGDFSDGFRKHLVSISGPDASQDVTKLRSTLKDLLNIADDKVTLLPNELLEKLNLTKDQANTRLQTALTQLSQSIDHLSDDSVRAFVQVLQSGALIVKNNEGNLSVYMPDLSPEAKDIATIALAAADNELKSLADDLNGQVSKLTSTAEQLVNEKDVGKLHEMSGTIKNNINALADQKTNPFLAKIAADRKAVHEKEVGEQIATLDIETARAEVEKAAAQQSIRQLEQQKAQNELLGAADNVDMQQLKSSEVGADAKAEYEELALAKARRDEAYCDCITSGFDPTSSRLVGRQSGDISLPGISPVASLGYIVGISGNENAADAALRLQIQQEVEEPLFGMIDWATLMNLPPNPADGKTVEYFLTTAIQTISSMEVVTTNDQIFNKDAQAIGDLSTIAKKLKEYYGLFSPDHVDISVARPDSGPREGVLVDWRVSPAATEKNLPYVIKSYLSKFSESHA